MMEFIEQMAIIEKAHNLDYHKVIYPTVINSGLDPVDITDILTIIKDVDIYKYSFIDTAVRDYCIDLCEKMLKEVENNEND